MHDNISMSSRQMPPPSGPATPLSIADWLRTGRQRLLGASDSPRLDCEVLLAHALDLNRAGVHARSAQVPEPHQAGRFERLLAERERGRPVAQIVGRKEFHSLDFEVTAEVLVPRPETELLAERIHAVLAARGGAPHCLDLGTGCGAVAVALARMLPDARITASDLSPASLTVARRNAARLAPGRIRFVQGSWYSPLDPARRFDAIACNPPYVESGLLNQPPLNFEPRAALDGGPAGLRALRDVIAGAPRRLAPGGTLGVEHGHRQGAPVRALMAAAGLVEVATHRDLAGLERVTLARRPQ